MSPDWVIWSRARCKAWGKGLSPQFLLCLPDCDQTAGSRAAAPSPSRRPKGGLTEPSAGRPGPKPQAHLLRDGPQRAQSTPRCRASTEQAVPAEPGWLGSCGEDFGGALQSACLMPGGGREGGWWPQPCGYVLHDLLHVWNWFRNITSSTNSWQERWNCRPCHALTRNFPTTTCVCLPNPHSTCTLLRCLKQCLPTSAQTHSWYPGGAGVSFLYYF